MQDQIHTLKQQALDDLQQVSNTESLPGWFRDYLGKKGAEFPGMGRILQEVLRTRHALRVELPGSSLLHRAALVLPRFVLPPSPPTPPSTYIPVFQGSEQSPLRS